MLAELLQKRLDLLREMKPGAGHVHVGDKVELE